VNAVQAASGGGREGRKKKRSENANFKLRVEGVGAFRLWGGDRKKGGKELPWNPGEREKGTIGVLALIEKKIFACPGWKRKKKKKGAAPSAAPTEEKKGGGEKLITFR